jgi:mono/diheme cytochrome c family protein
MPALIRGIAAALVAVAVASGVRASDDKAALAEKALAIFKANCYRCHGQEGANEGGFNYVLDRQRLVAGRKIVPGDSAQSRLFKKLKKEEMPPEDEKPRPTQADIGIIREWIEAGAPDFHPASARRAEITTSALLNAIQDDLKTANERERPYLRYFTITHLYNAGWSNDELESYRMALSKLINSLSWGRRVVKPVAVDSEKTILRIDLRDYKWSDKVWNRILEANPYGVDLGTKASKYCSEVTSCPLPYVRADWFVAASSRPPLYHDVLQLPQTDAELEKQLHVDVEENIRQEKVSRAGFNGSGVSRNNRLIERHESGYGAYWKSYDFGSSAGPQNLFEHPRGPGGAYACDHNGGEIIFNLPNGFQGYMLVDGKGNRIDKGPTTIVSDPKQADRAVVNGLSCMSCHSKGMIEKSDQVRASVMQNPKAFDKKEADTILALYPPKNEMDKLMQEDADRYARAVGEAGCRVDYRGRIQGSDPVVNLAHLFDREVDLPLAAAEVGVKVEALVKAMDRSPSLARALGVLKVEGGTMQREAFVAVFGDLVLELKIGVFISVRGAETSSRPASGGPLRPGDRIFREGPVVYLADLPEFDVKKGAWPFTKDGTTGNPTKDRIKVKGNLSPKGLGMHPPGAPEFATVKYRLGKQAALFKAIVAIDDTATFCFTPAIFTVWGDEKKLFESKWIAHNHSRTQDCSVDVSGVDVLELRVGCVGHNHGVHAVWVEPRLLRRADTDDKAEAGPKKLFEKGPREYLSNLTEIESKAGPWPFAKNGDTGNGEAITVNGETSPKGLGLHPPSQGNAAVRYRLDKKAAVFKGAVALDDRSNVILGQAIFEVRGDGKRLWRSKAVNKSHIDPQEFSLNVSGVTLLDLYVLAPGNHIGLHAVWIEPRLLQKKDTEDK